MALTDPHRPPPSARVAVGDELQGALVDLLDLALLGRQLQWAVTGPRARALAELLDDLIGAWRRSADIVGDRIRDLGRLPNGQAHAIAVESRLEPVPTRHIAAHDAAYELAARIRETAAHVALSVEVARPLDPRSARLLAELGEALDGQVAAVGVIAPTAPPS